MSLKTLRLINFRNYENADISFSDTINVFCGENAQGKTNIIEAVFINAIGKSHRASSDGELIKLNEAGGKIKADFTKKNVFNTNEFIYSREGIGRQILRNGKRTNISGIIGEFNAILFSPEDLMLIKGSPALRRKFLDREISQADPSYYHNLCKFTRILTQRNKLLKEIRERRTGKETLSVWDEQFAFFSAAVIKKRIIAVDKLTKIAAKMQAFISGERENLTVSYNIYDKDEKLNINNIENWYLQKLQNRRETDILRGSTGIGPQLDDLLVFINDESLKAYGSQGQQRTTVLALKLAELNFLREETGEYPILLLDDVMSELDSLRRSYLASFLREQNIQTLITSTDKSFFDEWSDIAMWQVKNGDAVQIK